MINWHVCTYLYNNFFSCLFLTKVFHNYLVLLESSLAVWEFWDWWQPAACINHRLDEVELYRQTSYCDLPHGPPSSEFMGKTFQAAQLTHERFLTIDHSCKIFFWDLPNWTSTDPWCVVTSVPLKKIVTCVGIYLLCLYHEFYGKFFFHIANSSCHKLWNEAYYISLLYLFIKIFLKTNTSYYLFKWDGR